MGCRLWLGCRNVLNCLSFGCFRRWLRYVRFGYIAFGKFKILFCLLFCLLFCCRSVGLCFLRYLAFGGLRFGFGKSLNAFKDIGLGVDVVLLLAGAEIFLE